MKILPSSWKDSLRQRLKQYHKNNRLDLPRTCIIGVGSDLRGDDSVGLMVVRALLQHFHQTSHLLILEGGSAPENLTGRLRLFKPELILFIDAAHLGESSGTAQWIPLDAIDGMSASTHSLPLSLLARYLDLEIKCDIAILGIQPEQNEFDTECSQPVLFAVRDIVSEISNVFHLFENNIVPHYKEIYTHS